MGEDAHLEMAYEDTVSQGYERTIEDDEIDPELDEEISSYIESITED